MQITIHGRSFSHHVAPHVQHIFQELDRRKLQYQIYDQFSAFLNTQKIKHQPVAYYSSHMDMWQADMVFSIGGDGTLLDTLTFVRDSERPIFGINAGRMGFLANTASQEIRWGLEQVFSGNFMVENRRLLRFSAEHNVFDGASFALNEVAITKRDTSSMVLVHTFLNGEYLNAYWADGLLVSTPTGSSGYNLSVGGPIVVPESRVFVISPVSPHNLSVRPMVVPDDSVLTFQVESRTNSFLVALDGRSQALETGIKITVEKEQFDARLVRLSGGSFVRTLRAKLNWGLDVRN